MTLPRETLTSLTQGPEETRALGEAIGRRLRGGDLLALMGELGAGKTTLVQGIAKGVGVTSSPITSPTFVLINTHRGRLLFHHIDLYRLENLGEIEELGLCEYIGGEAISVIEWADRAASLLPQEQLSLSMAVLSENEREFTLVGIGGRYRDLIRALKEEGPWPWNPKS